ncbi:uncharacterized protein LOC131245604 isoform X2 [Magnolia sinica]|uniref:uncharacterized protein LOC131245604 isoform X2 n=1 Tax=Magnolia sinica TaxID=86752 RepID=UPI00265814B7|nr:uncharacterized protein LOC131245604 isoform X2 [Magnolia sinica]
MKKSQLSKDQNALDICYIRTKIPSTSYQCSRASFSHFSRCISGSKTMQRPSLFLSTPTPVSILPYHSLNAKSLLRKHCRSSSIIHPWTKQPFTCSLFSRTTPYLECLHSTGTRWLKVRVSGKETIQEVELTEGRGHPGQRNWILSFRGIDTVDKARQIVGSTLLVRETDRPALEEGEFYIPDLVGMRVVLKETGKPVGTVVNVFNSGASDLLQVMLNSAEGRFDRSGSSETESGPSGPLVWVPFVEAIVPDVDMNRREMRITPPKGLLELNIRSDGRSKKERRQLEWKQRKKAQQRFITAKKKLNELGQQHLLQGFSSGDKAQKNSLANQIVGINFKLLQQAIQNIDKPSIRYNLRDFINANSIELLNNTLRISSEDKLEADHQLYKRGLHLMSEGNVAIILVTDGNNDNGSEYDFDAVGCSGVEHQSNILQLLELLLNDKKFPKMIEEWRTSIPLIIVSAAQDIQSSQEHFSDHDYFGFDQKKVWFLEEEKLPVVRSSLTAQNRHEILLKSPWEILQSPVGSGGVISLLSSHDIVQNLTEMGVQYVEVCRLVQRSAVGHPSSFGFVDLKDADIGIKIWDDSGDADDYNLDMIFSMRFLQKITKQIDKLHFYAAPKQNSHIEKVGEEWVDVHPTSPNSYHLHCSIYSCLNICSPDKICLMQIAD